MASIEQTALGALLRTANTGDPFPGAPGLDDGRLLALARHHRLSPLLAARGAPGLPPAVADAARADRLATLGRTTLLRSALAPLLEALGAAGVEAAVLKGIAYEERIYAAEAGGRPAADIDLLIRPEARRSAFAALTASGYTPAAGAPGYDEPDYHEVTFRRRGVAIDLHFGLAPRVRCRIDYPELWAKMQPLVVEGVAARTLDDGHAALNQALHMTIHHFDVPALFLVDLERLLESAGGQAAVEPVARAWRCRRPLETAAALAAAFVRGAAPAPLPARADRVIRGYGGLAPLPRAEQLRRKVEHFDAPVDALRYLAVQGRRVLRERLLAIARRRRSAAERLGVEASPGAGGPHDR